MVSARKIVVVKRAEKPTLAVSTVIAENGVLSDDILSVGLDQKSDGDLSAKPTLSRVFSKKERLKRFQSSGCFFCPG